MLSALLAFGLSAATLNEVNRCNDPAADTVKRVVPQWPTDTYVDSGYVTVEVNVDSYGYVHKQKIVDAQPARVFDRSAKKALAKWVFEKSEKQTRCFVITLEFSLGS